MRLCLVVAPWVGMARFTTKAAALTRFRHSLVKASTTCLPEGFLHITNTVSG
jgi:hypothetical protein